MPKIKYARDLKCTDCKESADVFFPCVYPDIPAYPYCHACAEKRKEKLMLELFKVHERMNPPKKIKRYICDRCGHIQEGTHVPYRCEKCLYTNQCKRYWAVQK